MVRAFDAVPKGTQHGRAHVLASDIEYSGVLGIIENNIHLRRQHRCINIRSGVHRRDDLDVVLLELRSAVRGTVERVDYVHVRDEELGIRVVAALGKRHVDRYLGLAAAVCTDYY